ncbi:hypothetical protein PV328_004114 [Microctonus aethiopoides]|uniref:Uncharacterized protein n=1 Tax=Microctonus aethiopoides TaxID=144406 RepID=A0AA39KLC4_9HYME|nr:hypothetical protein PV328_004114 [Microctonus aethiopoides]
MIEEKMRLVDDPQLKQIIEEELVDLYNGHSSGQVSNYIRNFWGSYKVINVKRNHLYDVKKVDQHEEPIRTSSAADYMKPWAFANDFELDTESESELSGNENETEKSIAKSHNRDK